MGISTWLAGGSLGVDGFAEGIGSGVDGVGWSDGVRVGAGVGVGAVGVGVGVEVGVVLDVVSGAADLSAATFRGTWR
jgi:hypothetical protein